MDVVVAGEMLLEHRKYHWVVHHQHLVGRVDAFVGKCPACPKPCASGGPAVGQQQ